MLWMCVVHTQVPPATGEEKAATLQKLGLIAGCALLLPQLLWGFSPPQAALQVRLVCGVRR